MKKDLETARVEFDQIGEKLFFSYFNQFESMVRVLDRREDDNVFQQLQGKYVQSLKLALEALAMDMIHQYQQTQDCSGLSRILTEDIAMYIHEFILKSRSL